MQMLLKPSLVSFQFIPRPGVWVRKKWEWLWVQIVWNCSKFISNSESHDSMLNLTSKSLTALMSSTTTNNTLGPGANVNNGNKGSRHGHISSPRYVFFLLVLNSLTITYRFTMSTPTTTTNSHHHHPQLPCHHLPHKRCMPTTTKDDNDHGHYVITSQMAYAHHHLLHVNHHHHFNHHHQGWQWPWSPHHLKTVYTHHHLLCINHHDVS